MDINELNYYYNKFKFGEDIGHTLMEHRVKRILLVSTFYDAFIFEQDGRLTEQIFGEYHQLNLTYAPRIISVPTSSEALRRLEEEEFDLVITMMHTGHITPFQLSRSVKEKYPDLPVILLLNNQSDVCKIDKNSPEMEFIDNVFLWNGDSNIFLAIIKYIEDKKNVEHDTEIGLVRVIMLIEDSISYYSRFIPMLFREIMTQVQQLIAEELNHMQKNYRMRTRPKVLLVHSYEEAVEIYRKYREYLICVISDIRFDKDGLLDKEAGYKFLEFLREEKADFPILLQSSEESAGDAARRNNVAYLSKNSESLLEDLSTFIQNNLGFGEFVFRTKYGEEIDRADTMVDFEEKLKSIPDNSFEYHARRNHFSVWLLAHGENLLAKKIRPLLFEDFRDTQSLRTFLINIFEEVRKTHNKGNIVDFNRRSLRSESEIVTLSNGSLGGKGRGLAFLNALITTIDFEKKYDEVNIKIPKTAFIGSCEFDRFMKKNKLRYLIYRNTFDDSKIQELFVNAELSSKLKDKLRIYLETIDRPIAVRSSGLLEDSQAQPFAGIYQTYMLPNNHPDIDVRQKQVEKAIKLVFASLFLDKALSYVSRISYRAEEEKMSVIIQEIAGEQFEDFYYPHFSGVAQSYNYYPTSYMKHKDGVASLALGLGAWVVNGHNTYRYCPKYPKIQMLDPRDVIKNSQKEYYAVDLKKQDFELLNGEHTTFATLDLKTAESHGTISHIASVWDSNDMRFRDGIDQRGPRVITFADILKYDYFPLSNILREILELGETAFGCPVEIEFAVRLKKSWNDPEPAVFYILQIRPITVHAEELMNSYEEVDKNDLFIYTDKGMGNGLISNLYDIVFIDPDKFKNTETIQMLEEIKKINHQMNEEDRDYILIGPGRWGSRDRFLGVPVNWADINRAKVIVEAGIEGFNYEASQGTHFFHNLVSANAGYFSISLNTENEFVDWDWLKKQNIFKRSEYFIHIRSKDNPYIAKMYGKKGISMVFKNDVEDD